MFIRCSNWQHISKNTRGFNSMRHCYWSPRAKQGSWKLSKHKLLPKRLPPWLFVLRTSFRSSLRTTYRLLYIREKHWQNGKTFIAASSRLVYVFSCERLTRWVLYIQLAPSEWEHRQLNKQVRRGVSHHKLCRLRLRAFCVSLNIFKAVFSEKLRVRTT